MTLAMGITIATALSCRMVRLPKVGADAILTVYRLPLAHARRIVPKVASAQLSTAVLTVAVHLVYISLTVPVSTRTANLGGGMA